MATDPYHAVQQEVQNSLQAADTLRASFRRIASTARAESEELAWAREELKGTLAALEADLEDLAESVKIVEETGPQMFGIPDAELTQRKQYVARVRREVQDIRGELAAPPGQSRRSAPMDDGAADEQTEWAREEQQMIMQQQDHTIDAISGTLSTLAEQAGLIGREIVEHNELLSDLEDGVDNTSAKLGAAMKKLQKFIRDTEETKSGWCIVILIIVLLALLLAVILI